MRTIRRSLSRVFPRAAQRYRRLKTDAYNRSFQMFPILASAIREYRQGAHKSRRSSFGMDLIGPAYLIDSDFESEEIALISQQLPHVDVFVDVGANIGLYVCLAASQDCRVVTVEPLASNLRYLYQNAMRNNVANVEVFPVGLSSSPGLSVLAGIGAQASFLRNWATQDYGFNQYVETVCPISTLDVVLGGRFSGKRLLIKIDVEGFEYQVLQGASATLEMSPKPTWIMECFLERYHPGGRNPNFQQTFEMFFDRGYTARVASRSGPAVTREIVSHWVTQGNVPDGFSNFIFSPLNSGM